MTKTEAERIRISNENWVKGKKKGRPRAKGKNKLMIQASKEK